MKKIITVLFLSLTVLTSCRKTETSPCEGLLNESQPLEIIVKFIDKQTKETLLVDASGVKITEKQSGSQFSNWGLYNRPGFPDLKGAVVIPVTSESVGEYQYSIQFGSFGTATVSYQIKREETDNACKPFSYPISDIKITNQPFDVLQYEGKTYPKILVVAL